MQFVPMFNRIFEQSILDYHKTDNVDQPIDNPYELKSIEY